MYATGDQSTVEVTKIINKFSHIKCNGLLTNIIYFNYSSGNFVYCKDTLVTSTLL